jgi:hypothetical protein
LARKTKAAIKGASRSRRTFITYAHESTHFDKQVLDLADKLRALGVDSQIDQYESHPAKGWPRWMEDQFANADAIVVVASKKYLERYNQDSGIGSGARFEATILRSKLMKNGVSFQKTAVALIDKSDEVYIPNLLHGCQRYVVSNSIGFENLYRWLTDQPAVIAPKLGFVQKLSSTRHVKSTLNFQGLCRALKPLLEDNYRVFRDFGPNSDANSKGPLRHNLNAWYALRRSKILPNNSQIRSFIVECRDIIPRKYKTAFQKLISHIDAFEAHVDNDLVDYREHQFPSDIVDIVERNLG